MRVLLPLPGLHLPRRCRRRLLLLVVAILLLHHLPRPAASWEWRRVRGSDEAFGFPARDGACAFRYYNRTDRTFRAGVFGGTTQSGSGSDSRTSFKDFWVSGPDGGATVRPGGRRWVQVQRAFDRTGAPLGDWPRARWDHACVVIPGDSRAPEAVAAARRHGLEDVAPLDRPFTLLVMGGQIGAANPSSTSEAWNMTFVNMSTRFPVALWHRVNHSSSSSDSAPSWTARAGHQALSLQVERIAGSYSRGQLQTSGTTGNHFIALADTLDVRAAMRPKGRWSETEDTELILPPGDEDEGDARGIRHVVMLMGGLTKFGFRGDVWLSWDAGQTWEQRSPRGFSGRYFFGAAAMGERSVIVFGGRSGSSSSAKNDVYRTQDLGQTWKKVASAAKWSPRYRFSSVSMILPRAARAAAVEASLGRSTSTAGELTGPPLNLEGDIVVLTGGYSSGKSIFYGDSWATNDGVLWTQQVLDAPVMRTWHGRSGHASLLMPATTAADATNTFRLSSTATPFAGGGEQEAQVRPLNKLLLFGGRNKGGRLADVWVREGPVLLTNRGQRRGLLCWCGWTLGLPSLLLSWALLR